MKTPKNNAPEKKPMNNDYLWDGSGKPDPEIQRLESLLSEFRQADRPLDLPAHLPVAPGKFRGLLIQMPWIPRLAAAAVVLLTLGAAAYFFVRPTGSPNLGPAWDVATLQGTTQIGPRSFTGTNISKLHVGQTLVTSANSRASLYQLDLGEIKIDPNSRVRLIETNQHRKRIQLEVGTIHAAIWAPAGQFVVDTPSAVAVDLGCAYTLQVAPDGSGTIRTTLGWVGFQLNGRDSFIPAGAMCSTHPGIGPDTPYFEDTSPSFREALSLFDHLLQSTDVHSRQLDIILSHARAKDALTLWHLLSRTTGRERAQVYDRLAALVPAPHGVTREGILRLDPKMLDLYWNALGLGDIYIWRYWEQSSDPKASPPPPQLLPKKQALVKQAP